MAVLAFAAVAAIKNAGEIIREKRNKERERKRERERRERESERERETREHDR
jgi:hypothetical protein